MKKILVIATFLFAAPIFSQESSKAVRINLGVFYSQRNVYRGALIWDAPVMAAGPSFVFYDTVSLGAGGLSVFKKLGEMHTFTLGASMFDDNEPSGPILKLKDSVEDFKNKRSSTFGTYIKYDFHFKQYVATSLEFHKDLKRHKGVYTYVKVSTSIVPFVTIGIGHGIGDDRNNHYVYGADGKSGSGHFDMFASLMLPILPWSGRLMLNYAYTQITQQQNVDANFVRGRKANDLVSVGALWSF